MRVEAPEFPGELQWLNTATPPSLPCLRGKVVLLNFWSYCSVNCLHVLPELHYLQEKYPQEVAVISIHTPKFPHQVPVENVRKAIFRHEMTHPVANDPEWLTWQRYGVRAWPTVVVVDGDGKVAGTVIGEGNREQLDVTLRELIAQAKEKGPYRPAPVPVSLGLESTELFLFPGKVIEEAGQLYVSDSGHNQVIELTPDGQPTRVFGSGVAGLADGVGEQCMFRNPQGMAAVEDTLYVADTGNHAIRQVNLVTGQVRTLAGNGLQAYFPGPLVDSPSRTTMNSPWDVACLSNRLYIAMAGSHQIWEINLALDTIRVLAGSGQEGLADGVADEGRLAQPSGVAVGGDWLYVADAQCSGIRRVRLADGTVETLVGTGLFDFGDADGIGRQARLQHPMDVSFDGEREALWIADTYNNKIRRFQLASRRVLTFDIEVPLSEPSGVWVAGPWLWVTSTNAHQLLRVDMDTGKTTVFGEV